MSRRQLRVCRTDEVVEDPTAISSLELLLSRSYNQAPCLSQIDTKCRIILHLHFHLYSNPSPSEHQKQFPSLTLFFHRYTVQLTVHSMFRRKKENFPSLAQQRPSKKPPSPPAFAGTARHRRFKHFTFTLSLSVSFYIICIYRYIYK